MESGNPNKWDMLQLQSDPICSSAGCTQYKQEDKGPGYPMDYPVPNFGVDEDVGYTENNIKMAEIERKHVMTAVFKPVDGTPRNYFVPDFGVDEDIAGVQDSIAWSQNDFGTTWTPIQDANGYWDVPS